MEIKEVMEFFNRIGIEKLKGKAIGLIGDLGIGKTHLVKLLIEQLADKLGDQVTSPTYSLCNIYQSPALEIRHFDLYRIESEDDLYDTGVLEAIEDREVLVIIEWIDLYPSLMSACDLIVTITLKQQNGRNYQLSTIKL
jgi:tRNA threonylcarbamoyladenosine biosynthesis protein TsaE